MEAWWGWSCQLDPAAGPITVGEGRGVGASFLPSEQRPEWDHTNRGKKRVYFCVIIKNFYKLLS